MVACFRIGAVALACNEQLRAQDLVQRIDAAAPKLIVADERTPQELTAAAPAVHRADHPGSDAVRRPSRRRPSSSNRRSVPDHVHQRHHRRGRRASSTASATSRASGSSPSTGSTPGRAIWCGAPPPPAGPNPRATRSSRHGCAAPPRCCTTPASTRPSGSSSSPPSEVNVLCMAPTEYRVIAKRATAQAAARPALSGRRRRGAQPGGDRAPSLEADRARDPRRLRPDRDRPADGQPARRARPPGLDGPPAARRRSRVTTASSCCADPATDPTFFVGPRGGDARADRRAVAHRRPGHPGRRRLPVLRGALRRRDHLRRVPDRPVRGRVGARRRTRRSPRRRSSPRPTRSAARSCAPSSSCATGSLPSDALATELQDHVKHGPLRTSTRASSSSPTSCPRPPAERSSGLAPRNVALGWKVMSDSRPVDRDLHGLARANWGVWKERAPLCSPRSYIEAIQRAGGLARDDPSGRALRG